MTDQQQHLEDELAALEQSGGWYTLPDGSKVQGRAAALEALAHREELAEGYAELEAAEADATASSARNPSPAVGYIGRLPAGERPPLNPAAARGRRR